MGNTTLKKMLAIIINLSIVIMEIIAFAICYQKDGLSCFQYYTQDSNLFLMVTSFIFLIYETINLKNKEEIPHWVSILKYSATTCVTTTFLVVVTVLAPIMGGYKAMMLDGTMLYHHLICPILAFVSFIFLENHKIGGSKDALIAMIFTVVYGIIAVALNIFKIMNGPYPFLRVYEQSLLMSIMWVILMNGSAYLLNLFMAYLTKLVNKKNI